jgi:phosphoglycolate phosphatase
LTEKMVASHRWTAALVDLDGTLVDTRPGVRAAIAAAFADITGDGNASERADLSLPLDDMIRSIDADASASRLRLLSEAFRRHYDNVHWASADVYPGAEDFLRGLRTAGIRAFVATNKRTTAAQRLLEHVGLAQYLEGIVGQPDSGQPLPKSELIGECMATGGLDRATTVIVGDSDQDAAAASSWGMVFVAVTSGAGPLGHALVGEERVEVESLADATAIVMRRARGDQA